MDKKIELIRHLYGEVDDRAARRELLRDDELAREYRAMETVKFHLDHQPAHRPDADVLASVFAAAEAGHAPGTEARTDRKPVARGRRRLAGVAGIVSLGVAALLVVAVWWQPAVLETTEVASSEPAPFADERLAPQAADVQMGRAANVLELADSVQAPAAGLTAEAEATPDVLAWDAGEEVRRLRQRIDVLEQQRLRAEWDEPLRPAGYPGVAPAPSRLDRGLRSAGERRY